MMVTLLFAALSFPGVVSDWSPSLTDDAGTWSGELKFGQYMKEKDPTQAEADRFG